MTSFATARASAAATEMRLGDGIEAVATTRATVLITDPVWPNNSVSEFADIKPVATLRAMCANILATIRRAAFHLGCDRDPRWLFDAVPLPFFRVCWLRYAVPHYKGRLLYTGDVAYLFGTPPKSRPGARVIPGECTALVAERRDPRHPTPRKLEHARWLVAKWTEPGDLVIDPFAGIGTTGVACTELGRDFIGVERDAGYVAVARERIADATRQLRLCA